MNAISLNRVLNASSFVSTGIPRSESIPNSAQNPGSADEQSSAANSKKPAGALEKSTVEISKAGRAKARELERSGKADKSGESKEPSASNLTDEEKAQVAELQKSDRQTRAHEQAHLGAAGGLAKGGASFNFTKGPDGRLYAVGGEVSIDTSPVPGDPDATIRKADTIRRAALAPSEPSSQDKSVAAQAGKMANEARTEKLKSKQSDAFSNTADGEEKSELGKKFDSANELGELLDLVV